MKLLEELDDRYLLHDGQREFFIVKAGVTDGFVKQKIEPLKQHLARGGEVKSPKKPKGYAIGGAVDEEENNPSIRTQAPATQTYPDRSYSPQQEALAGIDRQMGAISEQADINARLADAQAATQQWLAQRQVELRDEYAARHDAWAARGAEIANSIMNSQIDPNRLWANSSTGGKIAAGIGMVLGGLGAALQGGGPNLGYQALQTAIDRDVDAQKANLGKLATSYSFHIQEGAREDQAYNLARADTLDMAAALTQANAFKFASPAAQQAAQMMIGDLQQKAAASRIQTASDMLDQQLKQTQIDAGQFQRDFMKAQAENWMMQRIQRQQELGIREKELGLQGREIGTKEMQAQTQRREVGVSEAREKRLAAQPPKAAAKDKSSARAGYKNAPVAPDSSGGREETLTPDEESFLKSQGYWRGGEVQYLADGGEVGRRKKMLTPEEADLLDQYRKGKKSGSPSDLAVPVPQGAPAAPPEKTIAERRLELSERTQRFREEQARAKQGAPPKVSAGSALSGYQSAPGGGVVDSQGYPVYDDDPGPPEEQNGGNEILPPDVKQKDIDETAKQLKALRASAAAVYELGQMMKSVDERTRAEASQGQPQTVTGPVPSAATGNIPQRPQGDYPGVGGWRQNVGETLSNVGARGVLGAAGAGAGIGVAAGVPMGGAPSIPLGLAGGAIGALAGASLPFIGEVLRNPGSDEGRRFQTLIKEINANIVNSLVKGNPSEHEEKMVLDAYSMDLSRTDADERLRLGLSNLRARLLAEAKAIRATNRPVYDYFTKATGDDMLGMMHQTYDPDPEADRFNKGQ